MVCDVTFDFWKNLKNFIQKTIVLIGNIKVTKHSTAITDVENNNNTTEAAMNNWQETGIGMGLY